MKEDKEILTHRSTGRIGPWTMLRDIFVTATIHGQLPTAVGGLFVNIWLVRVPSEDLSAIVQTWLSIMQTKPVGYALAFFWGLGWIVHINILKYLHRSKIELLNFKHTQNG